MSLWCKRCSAIFIIVRDSVVISISIDPVLVLSNQQLAVLLSLELQSYGLEHTVASIPVVVFYNRCSGDGSAIKFKSLRESLDGCLHLCILIQTLNSRRLNWHTLSPLWSTWFIKICLDYLTVYLYLRKLLFCIRNWILNVNHHDCFALLVDAIY